MLLKIIFLCTLQIIKAFKKKLYYAGVKHMDEWVYACAYAWCEYSVKHLSPNISQRGHLSLLQTFVVTKDLFEPNIWLR